MLELQHQDMLLYWQSKYVPASAAISDVSSDSHLPEDEQVRHTSMLSLSTVLTSTDCLNLVLLAVWKKNLFVNIFLSSGCSDASCKLCTIQSLSIMVCCTVAMFSLTGFALFMKN